MSEHAAPSEPPPPVTGVRLRPWTVADAPVIAPALEDPLVRRWSHTAELGPECWIADQLTGRRGPSLAVCTASDERPLGKVALRLPGRASVATTCAAIRPDDRPVGELSYWVLPRARGRGVATAAVGAMLAIARRTEGIRSVVLDVEIDNHASIRVAQRVGAIRREPTRSEPDRQGVMRTLAVFVVVL